MPREPLVRRARARAREPRGRPLPPLPRHGQGDGPLAPCVDALASSRKGNRCCASPPGLCRGRGRGGAAARRSRCRGRAPMRRALACVLRGRARRMRARARARRRAVDGVVLPPRWWKAARTRARVRAGAPRPARCAAAPTAPARCATSPRASTSCAATSRGAASRTATLTCAWADCASTRKMFPCTQDRHEEESYCSKPTTSANTHA